MNTHVRKIKYFQLKIRKKDISEAEILTIFSNAGINYLAFNTKVKNKNKIMFTLYPEEENALIQVANENEFKLSGPYFALHIDGDNKNGECAETFKLLKEAEIKTGESFGIADIHHGYGIIIYIDEKEIDKAMKALSK